MLLVNSVLSFIEPNFRAQFPVISAGCVHRFCAEVCSKMNLFIGQDNRLNPRFVQMDGACKQFLWVSELISEHQFSRFRGEFDSRGWLSPRLPSIRPIREQTKARWAGHHGGSGVSVGSGVLVGRMSWWVGRPGGSGVPPDTLISPIRPLDNSPDT